jgi:hypothetical protein
MDALFVRGMRKHRHFGTLRCRQEGASTPSLHVERPMRRTDAAEWPHLTDIVEKLGK